MERIAEELRRTVGAAKTAEAALVAIAGDLRTRWAAKLIAMHLKALNSAVDEFNAAARADDVDLRRLGAAAVGLLGSALGAVRNRQILGDRLSEATEAACRAAELALVATLRLLASEDDHE